MIVCAPLGLILLAYLVADWVDGPLGRIGGPAANRVGFHLHASAPAAADRHLFGVVPSAWLQQRLSDGSPHWYDAVAALIYVTHFVMIPVVTGVAWFRLRDRFRAWMTAVLTFSALGVAGYVVYPAAPPWLASQQGLIAPVHRTSGTGWSYLHLAPIHALMGSGQGGSDQVAAMPSLHAGGALLVALFLWPVVAPAWRVSLVAYVVLMSLVLVYTGEHYVVDVVAGWLTAGVAIIVGAVVHPFRRTRASDAPVGDGAAGRPDGPGRLERTRRAA